MSEINVASLEHIKSPSHGPDGLHLKFCWNLERTESQNQSIVVRERNGTARTKQTQMLNFQFQTLGNSLEKKTCSVEEEGRKRPKVSSRLSPVGLSNGLFGFFQHRHVHQDRGVLDAAIGQFCGAWQEMRIIVAQGGQTAMR